MRNVITRVLPEPAPASTRIGPPPWLAASRCGGFSLDRSTGHEPVTLMIWNRSVHQLPTSYAPEVDRYSVLVDALREEIPGFRIVRKDESALHRAIDVALKVVTLGRMRRYLDTFQTTIGKTVYVTADWDTWDADDRYVTL